MIRTCAFFIPLFMLKALFAAGPYTSPGMTSYQEGQWVGSDHLLQVQMPIAFSLEISSQESVPLISSKEMEKAALDALKEEGIPISLDFSQSSFQPFLHILVLALKAPESVAFNVSTRLFEQVHLDRVRLNEGIFFQAVTWDYQSLHIAADVEFKKELVLAIQESIKTFASRLKRFQSVEEMKQKADEKQEEKERKEESSKYERPVFDPYPQKLPSKK